MRLLLVHSFLRLFSSAHTRVASYDDVMLAPPPLPDPSVSTSFAVQLQTGTIPRLSVPHQDSFFGSLFVAETLRSSNQSQVLDLHMNSDNEFTPGYAVYENGQPTRVALMNFADDNSGASDYTASISIDGTVPSHVRVKYLSASDVAQEYNITWTGQTFDDASSSDGRPIGVVDVQSIGCDQINNVCNVKVPAPGAALVFLSDDAPAESKQRTTTTATTKLSVLVASASLIARIRMSW